MISTLKNTSLILTILFLLVCSSCKKEVDQIACNLEQSTLDQSKKEKKVLIIGIDGFRADVLQDSIAPFLFQLSTNATCFFNKQHHTECITSSGPNWTSLLTGVHLDKHGVTNNNFTENHLDVYTHFYKYTELANPELNTVSVCHWIPISGFLARKYADHNPIQSFSDQDVFDHANSILNQTDSVVGDLIFLHFDDLDHNGHSFGFSKDIPEYRSAVSTMDQYVEGLMNTIDDRRNLGEDWLVFVVSDHGGEGTDHGNAADPNINQTIFFAEHPTVTFKQNIETYQVDLVPSVMDFIGITNEALTCHLDGKSIIQ